jgi:hypothetical protein
VVSAVVVGTDLAPENALGGLTVQGLPRRGVYGRVLSVVLERFQPLGLLKIGLGLYLIPRLLINYSATAI